MFRQKQHAISIPIAPPNRCESGMASKRLHLRGKRRIELSIQGAVPVKRPIGIHDPEGIAGLSGGLNRSPNTGGKTDG